MSRKPTYRPDDRGRISLGKLAEGVDMFLVQVQPDHTIKLTPMVYASKLGRHVPKVQS